MDYLAKIRNLAGHEKIILAGAAGAVIKGSKILLVRRHNLSRPFTPCRSSYDFYLESSEE
jgi:hypothetical protein